MTNQIQKGGDSSTNFQSEQMVVHLGIDEKRAREIYQEMNLQSRKDYSKEALHVANSRVAEFENRLMPKMEQVEGALEAFADPGFQLLLVEAQKTAAATERLGDYDLLSELLLHRFQKGENRITRAGISLAVEIVDKVSDDALLGLTVAHAVTSFIPASGDIDQGLDVLDELFGKIFYGELPTGHEWLDHLDILNAVRLNSLGGLKKAQQYYQEVLCGYVDVGIEKNSEANKKAIELLEHNKLPSSILVGHALNRAFLRVRVPNRKGIHAMSLQFQMVQEGRLIYIPVALSDEQKRAIEAIYDLYSQDDTLKKNNVDAFMGEWDKRPHLSRLKEWWDQISTSFVITSVGKVLAHVNAQRLDNKLPPMN